MKLAGKHIAITGALMFYTRAEAFAEIAAAGGIPQSSVTRETEILVVGNYHKNAIPDGKSRKLKTAERYIACGIKIDIITGETFLRLLWWT